jgi:hypothetical protein
MPNAFTSCLRTHRTRFEIEVSNGTFLLRHMWECAAKAARGDGASAKAAVEDKTATAINKNFFMA